jgi:hypothetical protein
LHLMPKASIAIPILCFLEYYRGHNRKIVPGKPE